MEKWCLKYESIGSRLGFYISNNMANALAFLFQTTFLELGGYSATNTITHAFFLNHYCLMTAISDYGRKIGADQDFCCSVIKLHVGEFCGIFLSCLDKSFILLRWYEPQKYNRLLEKAIHGLGYTFKMCSRNDIIWIFCAFI